MSENGRQVPAPRSRGWILVTIGSLSCFAGVIALAIGSGTGTGWLSMLGTLALVGGFFVAVVGRLAG